MKLDIGCGSSKKDGFIGLDILPFENVDIVHNLSIYPWPFADNTITDINMDNVLEHLEKPLNVINELYRISADGAKLKITVPYFRSLYAYIDPTHVNYFSLHWFDYLDNSKKLSQRYCYTKCNFEILSKRVFFNFSRWNLLGKIVVWFANKFPESYEYRLSRIFPADYIVFDLQVKK